MSCSINTTKQISLDVNHLKYQIERKTYNKIKLVGAMKTHLTNLSSVLVYITSYNIVVGIIKS